MDVAEVYRTLGRMEEAQSQTREILVRIEHRIDRQEERKEQRFRDVNWRIDQLRYTIVGIGAAVIVGYVLQQVFSG